MHECIPKEVEAMRTSDGGKTGERTAEVGDSTCEVGDLSYLSYDEILDKLKEECNAVRREALCQALADRI